MCVRSATNYYWSAKIMCSDDNMVKRYGFIPITISYCESEEEVYTA